MTTFFSKIKLHFPRGSLDAKNLRNDGKYDNFYYRRTDRQTYRADYIGPAESNQGGSKQKKTKQNLPFLPVPSVGIPPSREQASGSREVSSPYLSTGEHACGGGSSGMRTNGVLDHSQYEQEFPKSTPECSENEASDLKEYQITHFIVECSYDDYNTFKVAECFTSKGLLRVYYVGLSLCA